MLQHRAAWAVIPALPVDLVNPCNETTDKRPEAGVQGPITGMHKEPCLLPSLSRNSTQTGVDWHNWRRTRAGRPPRWRRPFPGRTGASPRPCRAAPGPACASPPGTPAAPAAPPARQTMGPPSATLCMRTTGRNSTDGSRTVVVGCPAPALASVRALSVRGTQAGLLGACSTAPMSPHPGMSHYIGQGPAGRAS